ncbi:MAG: peptidoglycan-binding domain-containing protein [Solirubrobacterales bacterium]
MANYFVLGSRTLRAGMQGSDVELVQGFLKALPPPIGSDIPMSEKGTFGAATEAAVRRFQDYFNIAVDGIVGKNTYLFLGVPTGPFLPGNANLFGSRELEQGDSGWDVWVLQNRLSSTSQKFADAIGHPANSYFDAGTQTAVKLFQRDTHLPDTGVVDPATFFNIYYYTLMGSRYLQQGRWDRSKGYDVYWLQRHLTELGYYSGNLSGFFGSATEAAVRRLQQASAIGVDGIVGPQTYYKLAVY